MCGLGRPRARHGVLGGVRYDGGDVGEDFAFSLLERYLAALVLVQQSLQLAVL